jgi:ATP-dependent DNA ligase
MTLPRVQPIIPTWKKEPFDDPEWLFDFKYDGFRGLCYIEQGRCCFLSRNGNVLTRFEALGDQLAALLQIDEAIIDGEVVAVDETGRPQFYDLLRRTQPPAYAAFDLLWLMVPTCDPCLSASAEGGCEPCCRPPRRSSPKRFPSPAAAANSSTDVRE